MAKGMQPIRIRRNSIKIRRNWGAIKPITKIVESEKIYDRKKNKGYLKNNET